MKKLTLLTIVLFSVTFVNAQWQQTSLSNDIVYSFLLKDTNIFASASSNGVYLSTNNGDDWTIVNNGLPNKPVLSLARKGNNIFAATGDYTVGDGVYLSTNNGENWIAINNGIPLNHSANSLAIIDNNVFVAIQDSGVYSSTNNGVNWALTGFTDNCALSLIVNGTNIFAGAYYNGVYLSTNNGVDWTIINNGLSSSPILSLAIQGSNIFAGTMTTGIYLTTNNGISWTAINNGLPLINLSVWSIVIDGTNIFAGIENGGVFLSTNNGINWIDVNDGLIDLQIKSLIINGNYILAGTYSSGIWKRSLSEILGIEKLNNNNNFSLFPNPAIDKITITNKYNSSNESTISIFNIEGQQILSNKFYNQNSIELDIHTLSKGIYLLKIQDGNKIENRKLIIQ